MLHLAFRVDDVAAAPQALLAPGLKSIREPPALTAAKAETALLADPSGLQIQIIRYQPDSPALERRTDRMGTRETAEHEAYIHRCLELARCAVQSGNAPFGALVVRDGEVIAECANTVRSETDVTAHAEMNVIRAACRALGTLDLSGCTLYTSAEPCFMCSYAIRQARISRVVIGARAEARGGVSSRFPVLADPDIPGWPAPPELVCDIQRDECTLLLHEAGFVHI